MTAAVWHPAWCSPDHCTAYRDSRFGQHQSEHVRVAANTQWLEAALYLAVNPYAVAWIVLTTGDRQFMIAPAEAQRLGMAMIDFAYAEARRRAAAVDRVELTRPHPTEAGDD